MISLGDEAGEEVIVPGHANVSDAFYLTGHLLKGATETWTRTLEAAACGSPKRGISNQNKSCDAPVNRPVGPHREEKSQ
jgi:hypothetical protein